MPTLLKSAAKSAPYPLFLRLFYLWHGATEARRARAQLRHAGIPLLPDTLLSAHKRSDVIFILGSGSSINNITADRWQTIAGHDSAALNLWPLHDFVPRFYFFENGSLLHHGPAEHLMLQAFARRAADYHATLKVVTEAHHGPQPMMNVIPEAFRANLFGAVSIPAPARNLAELEYALGYLQRRGLFSASGNFDRIFKYAASVTSLITLAARLRYKKIVLCGVDLKNGPYFFQDRDLYPEYAGLQFPVLRQTHPTNVALEWRLPAQEVVPALKSFFLEPLGIELYVENKQSALWPAIAEAPAELFRQT